MKRPMRVRSLHLPRSINLQKKHRLLFPGTAKDIGRGIMIGTGIAIASAIGIEIGTGTVIEIEIETGIEIDVGIGRENGTVIEKKKRIRETARGEEEKGKGTEMGTGIGNGIGIVKESGTETRIENGTEIEIANVVDAPDLGHDESRALVVATGSAGEAHQGTGSDPGPRVQSAPDDDQKASFVMNLHQVLVKRRRWRKRRMGNNSSLRMLLRG
jgi:hypothetical protein